MCSLSQGVTGFKPQEAGGGRDTDSHSEPVFPEHLARGKVTLSLIVVVEPVKDWLEARK